MQNKILETMKSWDTPDREMWRGYETLSDATGVPVKHLKSAMKWLKEEELVSLLHTSSDEGRCAGSGWFLTKKGRESCE